MAQRLRKIFVFNVVLSFLFILILFSGLLLYSGDWLLNGADKPEQSDAIVVLGGALTRSFYAVDLYQQGFAPRIYISRPIPLPVTILLERLDIKLPREEEINKSVLLKKNVPQNAIFFLGFESLSTAEEAEELKKITRSENLRYLIIASPYQARRAKMIFKDKIKNARIIVVATPYEEVPKRWWTNKITASDVILELTKILFYKTGHSFHSAK